jgi:hypothetical protein
MKRILIFMNIVGLANLAGGCSHVERVSDEAAKSVFSQGLPPRLQAAIAAGDYRCDTDGGVESSDGRVSFEIPGGLPAPLAPISDFWSEPVTTPSGLTLYSKRENIYLKIELVDGLYTKGVGVNDERCV